MAKLTTWQATVQDDDTGAAIVSPVVTVRVGTSGGALADLFDIAGSPIGNPVAGGVDGFVQFQSRPGRYWIQSEDTGVLSQPWYWDANPEGGLNWPNRADFVSDVAGGMVLSDGTVASGGPVQYVAFSGATNISDLPGWLPFGDVYPDHFGENSTPGTTDMTAAIQGAVDYVDSFPGFVKGEVRFFGFDYFVSSTITVNGNGVSLTLSDSCRILRSGDYGDTIHVVSSDPATTRLTYFRLSGGIIQQVGDMNSGAHLRITDAIHCRINDTHLRNGFYSVRLENAQDTVFSGIRTDVGEHWTGTKVGSRFLKIETGNNPSNENSSIYFNSCQWTFTGSPSPSPVEIGVEIGACDGIWFDGGHIIGADIEMVLEPDTASAQLQGVQIDNVWFDQFCSQQLVLRGDTSGTFADIELNNCQFLNATGYAIEIGEIGGTTNPTNITINGGRVSSNGGKFMKLNRGRHFLCNGVRVQGGVPTGTGPITAIDIAPTFERFEFSGCKVSTTLGTGFDNLSVGISIAGTSNRNYLISGIQFYDVDSEIEIDGATRDGSKILNVASNRSDYQDISAPGGTGATLELPASGETIEVTGSETTFDNISGGWDGRRVNIRSVSNAMTYSHAAGSVPDTIFLPTGVSSVTVNSNKSITFTYNAAAGAWYKSE